jgi:thymidylate synthase
MAMFYDPMPAASTPVRAWVEAAARLRAQPNFTLGGLMLHIEQPLVVGADEEAVIVTVDRFLRQHEKYPVVTVANTIFPSALDRGDGIDALRERYLPVYKRRMRTPGEWGRYFERMVNWEDRKGGRVDQLAENIRMLKEARDGGRFYENRYEIIISDPVRDMRKALNRQCLSMIELKPERNGSLHMIAVYRNHYYIQKTLGNLLGLGRLLGFIAHESGFDVGTLTLNSTSARLETEAWGKVDVTTLIDDCTARLIRAAA